MCIFMAAVNLRQATGHPRTLAQLLPRTSPLPPTLPDSHPLQHFLTADAAKMQMLGFLIATAYLHRSSNWNDHHFLLLLAGDQATASGLIQAFSRALTLDCAPVGIEGTHAMWHAWLRAVGTCAGFAVATSAPGNVGRPLGISFWICVMGAVVLIFGNVSGLDGGTSAGNVDTAVADERNFDGRSDQKSGIHLATV